MHMKVCLISKGTVVIGIFSAKHCFRSAENIYTLMEPASTYQSVSLKLPYTPSMWPGTELFDAFEIIPVSGRALDWRVQLSS